MYFLKPNVPAVILAPMEGVTDAPMREFLTRSGFFDYCVSEFIRVSANPVSPKLFLKHVPELKVSGCTSSHTPVQIQILGGNADRLAESALFAIEAGAKGIDLNFGCPAPTVNRHDGGATLLKYPERIETIIRTIRDAVPKEYPVSAKLRLGFDDPNAIYENARRVEQGGANWITIHGRTKTQGYIPPAYWLPIGKVKRALAIPVVANGEIWTLEDFKRCREETGSIHFMIGRGALAMPNMAGKIRRELGLKLIDVPDPLCFPQNGCPHAWADVFQAFAKIQPSEKRIKQWARYVKSKQNVTWWDQIKGLQSVTEILNYLRQLPEAQSSALTEEERLEQIEL